MVKVISGIYRGRNLETPLSDKTKPTKGSVKEAIFSSINIYFKDAKVLDLFAGSGAFGIEALSRGAKSCTFNDLGKEQIKVIKNNINNLKINNAKITSYDYKILLNQLDDKFNIVFVDPPYALDCYQEILDLLINNNLLDDQSCIILESNHEMNLENYENIFNIKEKKYGYTIINILKKK